jgi:catechol 2,3-dioxygenase-like lactoylglutathione lyase family enzyme
VLASSKLMAFAPSTDMKRARAFFEGVLGLRFVNEDSFAIVFDANGTPLRVANTPGFQPAPYTIVGWAVPQIERYVEKLKARGVSFMRYPGLKQDALGIWTSPSKAKVAWFQDPDGNVLSLTQFASAKTKTRPKEKGRRT